MRRRGLGIDIGRCGPIERGSDVVGVEHHVRPQRLDASPECSRGTSGRRRVPGIVVEHREQTRERRPDLREFIGHLIRPATRALINLSLCRFVGAETSEAPRDHIGELSDDMLGNIAGRPSGAATRTIPLPRVNRSDQVLEATHFRFELSLGDGAGQAHEDSGHGETSDEIERTLPDGALAVNHSWPESRSLERATARSWSRRVTPGIADGYFRSIILDGKQRTDHAPEPGATRAPRRIAIAVAVVAIAPFLVVIVTRAGRGYFPAQDLAVIDLRARDLWSLHPPLTGPWSRVGFAHPGPLFYWLLGVPSALAGGAAWSVIVGSAALQASAVLASARLAWIRGRLPLTLLVTAALSLGYVGVRGWAMVAPWNIYVAYPYFAVFLLLACSVGVGELRRLPWLVVVSTFLIQSHIGYALVLAGPLLWVVVRVLRTTRTTLDQRRALRHGVGWSVLWATLLWLPLLIDQLFVTGNLGAIWQYFSQSNEPRAGFAASARLLAAEFRVLPSWLGGPVRLDSFSAWALGASIAWLLIPVTLLVMGAWFARRNRDSDRAGLVALVAIAALGALVGIAQITGDLFGYLFEWRIIVAIFVIVAALWAMAPSVRPHPFAWRSAGAVLVGVVVTSSVVLSLRVVDVPRHLEAAEPVGQQFAKTLATKMPRSGSVLIRTVGTSTTGIASSLVNEFDRRGLPLRVDPWLDFEFGPQRRIRDRDAAAIWLVAEDGRQVSRLRSVPGGKLLVSRHALSARDERELSRLQWTLWKQLRRRGADKELASLDSPLFALAVANDRGINHRFARRVSELNGRIRPGAVCRCVVIAFPTDRSTLRRLKRLDAPPPIKRKAERGHGRQAPSA